MSGPPLVCGGSGVGYRLALFAASRAAPAAERILHPRARGAPAPSRDPDSEVVVPVLRPRA